MATRPSIYVTGTTHDLGDERKAVLDVIKRLGLHSLSIESFSASPRLPIETVLNYVRQCDVLVLIVGSRYGAMIPELGISYSEAEYLEAFRLHKPILIYVRSDNAAVPAKYAEGDFSRKQLLEKWKDRLRTQHIVTEFQSGFELAQRLAADLTSAIPNLEAATAVRDEVQSLIKSDLLNQINGLISDALAQGISEASLLSAVQEAISSLAENEEQRQPRVFLSYSRKDNEVVRRVFLVLKDHMLVVHFDVDIRVGTDWIKSLGEYLKNSYFMVFFISKNSSESRWAQAELEYGISKHITENRNFLIPVLLQEADISPFVKAINWLDIRDRDVEAEARKLARQIQLCFKQAQVRFN